MPIELIFATLPIEFFFYPPPLNSKLFWWKSMLSTPNVSQYQWWVYILLWKLVPDVLNTKIHFNYYASTLWCVQLNWVISHRNLVTRWYAQWHEIAQCQHGDTQVRKHVSPHENITKNEMLRLCTIQIPKCTCFARNQIMLEWVSKIK